MSLVKLLRSVALFSGLADDELASIAALCEKKTFPAGSTLVQQGATGDELYIIQDGQVEIVVIGPTPERPIVVLGKGQILGEMSLLDDGFRSATARATNLTTVQIIKGKSFIALCDQDHHIGYVVMHNLAADLSFKLRHRNLATM